MIDLAQLNAVPAAQFVASLDGIFEHSPWVAQRAALQRPFASRLDLLDAMRSVVAEASPAEQQALICAHPQLGARVRNPGDMTVASAREQRRAGLQACTPFELARLQALNAAYMARFAMPFILAVRGHDPASIIATLTARSQNELPLERPTALREIGLIAGYRLADVVATPPSVEVKSMLDRLFRVVQEGAPPDAALGMIREWLLAMDLAVTIDEQGRVIGRRHGSSANPKTLLMGVSGLAGGRTLEYDGYLGIVLAIAVLHDARHRALSLPYDVAIVVPALEYGRHHGAIGALPPFCGPLVPLSVPGFGPRTFAAPRAHDAKPENGERAPQHLDSWVRDWLDFLMNDPTLHDQHG